MATLEQFSFNKKNELIFYGQNLAQIKSATPSYLYSKKALQTRASLFLRELSDAFGDKCSIHYAMKANSNLTILKLLKAKKMQIDVVSGGEMATAFRAGFKPQDVLFSGVGKTVDEINSAISKKIFQINVESLPELIRIGRLSQTLRKSIGIGLRVNPGVNPKTHPYIATGFRENKFGIDSAQIYEAIEVLRQFPHLKYQGLSLHIGSQIFEFKDLALAISRTLQIEKELEFLGFSPLGIDIGGGLGVDYSKNAELVDGINLKKFISAIKSVLKNYPREIRLEPGRFLVARAGVLLTEVQYVKTTPYKNFAIVDTGMNHLLRPALYQAEHRIFEVHKLSKKNQTYDIVGPICESSDVLGSARKLSSLAEGDRLIIADAGAYGFSMASRYNSFELPEEIFI